jgi:hypothetical protein
MIKMNSGVNGRDKEFTIKVRELFGTLSTHTLAIIYSLQIFDHPELD